MRITSLTSVGTTATAVTSAHHELAVGSTIVVSNANPTGYNGYYRVASIVSETSFTYTIAGVLTPDVSTTTVYDIGISILEAPSGIAPTPISFTSTFGLYPINTVGTVGAYRRLSYPHNMLVPYIYSSNPHKTTNLDNDILYQIDYAHEKTYGGHPTFSWNKVKADIIITETWQNPTVELFRALYNYYLNPPTVAGEYIQWEPRDKNATVYNVKIIDLSTGSKELNINTYPAGTVIKDATLTMKLKIVN